MKRKLFSTKALVVSAMLCAVSVLFGKLPAIDISNVIRISFENLPVILAGVAYGPVAGGFVGGIADILGCLLKGYEINPIITFGAIAVGAISGTVNHILFKKSFSKISLLVSVVSSHVVGNMIIKTAGLFLWYESLRPTLIFRVPIYMITAACDYAVLLIVFNSKALKKMITEAVK